MTGKSAESFDSIAFQMHPRIFAALGADLVTNDVVAVIELVKNSYDALAAEVHLRFLSEDGSGANVLEIEDDGEGMTRSILEKVWCLVATPYKESHQVIKRDGKERRVAGQKGLGRLSAARLGKRLRMLTQARHSACWELLVDWDKLSARSDIAACTASIRQYPGASPFSRSGTRIRVEALRSPWDEVRLGDLRDNLARLMSPFAAGEEFSIYLAAVDRVAEDKVRIEAPEFLKKPKYSLKGNVGADGAIAAQYNYAPIKDGKARSRSIRHTWEQTLDGMNDARRAIVGLEKPTAGPFDFDIRAWDVAGEDTLQIAERFNLQKSKIRKAIRSHKGISVYRDGVLVLPKSDTARDWLGLDLRRVSKVGVRLSTSQVVGYVSISADANPLIKDTSDRERLVSNLAAIEFEELLKAAAALLENERAEDRTTAQREKPMDGLFEALKAEGLLSELEEVAQDDEAGVDEVLPHIRAFAKTLDEARKEIQQRFVYYSHLSTVGTIAEMLVHEIRNRTTAVGAFLELMRSRYAPFKDPALESEWQAASNSVRALERLADTFAPLASRSFRRGRRVSVLEERIGECVRMLERNLAGKGIKLSYPESTTQVAADPGELDAILLNLLTNAAYWLGQTQRGERSIEFRLTKLEGAKRVRVWVHDSGPGISEEDAEKIFLPGFTRRPGGIGMGLTVASELVEEYGGQMTAKIPGLLGGASFAFDLPLSS